jgi:hypothetical protein
MGREIKRIALDFEYPINEMIWKGYFNPYQGMKCTCCDGSGKSKEYKELFDSWYSHLTINNNGWSDKVTQDEVDALVDKGRLMDFTHEWKKDAGWTKKNPEYIPTAEEVNDWSKKGFGHDAINQWICCEQRAKRLGITELGCNACDGHGSLYPDEKYRVLCSEFEFIEPPAGEGYQLWSTTTEGTPKSPVFKDPEDLASWLAENNASSFGRDTQDYETWLKFITNEAWAPSLILVGGEVKNGVEAVADNV